MEGIEMLVIRFEIPYRATDSNLESTLKADFPSISSDAATHGPGTFRSQLAELSLHCHQPMAHRRLYLTSVAQDVSI